MKRLTGLMILTLVPALLLSGCGAPALAVQQPPVVQQAPQATAAPAAPAAVTPAASGDVLALETALSRVYDQVSPSVVTIRVMQRASGTTGGTRPGGQETGLRWFRPGLGSGFVLDMEGNIVTNNHVIEGADTVNVTFCGRHHLPRQGRRHRPG